MCKYDSKLIKLIVDNTPKTIFGLIIVSLIFIWTYIEYIPSEYLLVWSFLQIIFIIVRLANAKILEKYIIKDNKAKLHFHTVVFSVIVVLSSMIWSAGTLLGAMFAPTPYEFVSLAMIMGIVAAAILSLTPTFNVFLAYFFIMMLTQFGVMIYFGTHVHISIAVFLLIYMPMILLLSKSVYNNYLHTIESHTTLESYNTELRELSVTDSLTKAYNRRHFFESGETLVSVANREKSKISLLMIDVDFFKNVNDTYGHQVGDYVLVCLSQEIKSITRESDIFARMGGEEFAVILPNTSLNGSKVIAEKIRNAVETLTFEDNYISAGITVSIGCATINEKVATLEELYQEADKRLYVAKELGRNRVQ